MATTTRMQIQEVDGLDEPKVIEHAPAGQTGIIRDLTLPQIVEEIGTCFVPDHLPEGFALVRSAMKGRKTALLSYRSVTGHPYAASWGRFKSGHLSGVRD